MSDNEYSASGDSGFDNADASGSGRGSGSAAGRSARSARSSGVRSNARSNAGSSRTNKSRASKKARGGKTVVRTKQGGQDRAERLRALQAKANKTSKTSKAKSNEISANGIRAALKAVLTHRMSADEAADTFADLQSLAISELETIANEVSEATGFFVGPEMDLKDPNLMWCPSKIGTTLLTEKIMRENIANAKKPGKNGKKKKGVPQPAPAAYLPIKAAKTTQQVGADQLAINEAFVNAYKSRSAAVTSASPSVGDISQRIALALYNAPGDYKAVMQAILDVFRERLHPDERGIGLLRLLDLHSNSHLDYASANRVLIDDNGSEDGYGFVDPKIKTADIAGHGWPRLTKSGTATGKSVNETVREYYSKFSGDVHNAALINAHTSKMQDGFGNLKPAQVNILNELYPYLTAVGAGKGGHYHLVITEYAKCLACIDLADAFLLTSPFFGQTGVDAGVTDADMVKPMGDVGSAPVNKDFIMLAVAVASTI